MQSKRKNWANMEDWENPWISFCYWAWTWTWSIIKYNYSGNSSYNYRRRNHFPKEKKKSHPHWQEQRLPDLWQKWQLMLLDWLLLQIIKKKRMEHVPIGFTSGVLVFFIRKRKVWKRFLFLRTPWKENEKENKLDT